MYKLEFDTSSEIAAATVRSALIAYLEQETGCAQNLLPVEEIFNELVANVLQHGDRWVTIAILLIASLGAIATLSGCGGGFGLTTSKSYSITVTGTSGAIQQTTTVQLTVQ